MWNRLSTLELEWSDVELMFMLMLGLPRFFFVRGFGWGDRQVVLPSWILPW